MHKLISEVHSLLLIHVDGPQAHQWERIDFSAMRSNATFEQTKSIIINLFFAAFAGSHILPEETLCLLKPLDKAKNTEEFLEIFSGNILSAIKRENISF